jgi:hypothetical protein
LAQFVACYKLAGPGQERHENLERLPLEVDFHVVLTEFTAKPVQRRRNEIMEVLLTVTVVPAGRHTIAPHFILWRLATPRDFLDKRY